MYGNQYWPVCSSIFAWRTPSLTEKPGKPQSTGCKESDRTGDPARINTRLFFFFFFASNSCSPLRVEHEGSATAWLVGTLVAPSVQGHRLLCGRRYGPIRVFFRASCSWGSEDLFGHSFSIAPPVQALRDFPCLGSFSAVLSVRHREGPPYWGR